MTASIRSVLLGGICGGLGYHLASNEIWRSAAATGKRIDQLTLRNEATSVSVPIVSTSSQQQTLTAELRNVLKHQWNGAVTGFRLWVLEQAEMDQPLGLWGFNLLIGGIRNVEDVVGVVYSRGLEVCNGEAQSAKRTYDVLYKR